MSQPTRSSTIYQLRHFITRRFTRHSGNSAKSDAVVYLMLAPGIIGLLVFSVYPILWGMRYMFYEYDGFRTPVFIGIDNFVRVFTRDPDYWNAVKNTFIYAGGKLAITLPIAFILAVLLNLKIRGRTIFRTLIFMPTIISMGIMSLVFYFIFNTYNGIVNQVLLRNELIQQPIAWLGMDLALLTCIIVAVWGAVGNYMIYFLAGLQTIPTEMYESADIDGASALQKVFYITLPMLGPVLQMIMMLAIVVSLKGGYESIMVLTGGGPFGASDVMFLRVFYLFFNAPANVYFAQEYGYGAAVAFVSAIIVSLVTLIFLYWSKKMNETF